MYISDDMRAIFNRIADRDPDGWETTEPTDLDRLLHREWVHDTYGAETYRIYSQVEWNTTAVV